MKRLDWSVGQRLAAGTTVVSLLVAVLGIVMIDAVARVRALQQEQSTVIAPRAAAADALNNAIHRQAVAFRNYVITRSSLHLDAFHHSEIQVDQRLSRLADVARDSEGRILVDRLAPLIASHRSSFNEFIEMSKNGADGASLMAAEARITGYRGRILEDVQAYALLQEEQNDRAATAIRDALSRLFQTVIAVMLLIIVASFTKTYIVGRSVREPAAQLVAAAEALREGSFAEAIELQNQRRPDDQPWRDEVREAAWVFGRMAAALQSREERLHAHARLSAILGTTLEPQEIATRALEELSRHVGAEVAAVYLMDDDQARLRPLATLALAGDLAGVETGEGIPGQAAASRAPRVIRDIPADAPFHIGLGIDRLPPRCIAAVPMLLADRVIGVVVLASLRNLEDDAVRFVEQSAGQLAVTLDNALAHVRVADLASALQEKNEELQAQNEELQAQGEELQAQSEELQVQSEELQSQNEELQAQSEELQSQADELQSQADELRAQQGELLRANEALTRAEEQKNHFLAVLGHELRNPLAAISGAAALIDGGNGDREQDRTREVIRRQSAHLATLLDDLLDIGRITVGKIALIRRTLDLRAAAARCVAVLSAGLPASAPSIHVIGDDPVWIDADETRIDQIITNLLTNAIKFTPSGGTISAEVTREGEQAVLRVSDTGIGIGSDLLPKIFDFFVQGPEQPEGSGGLGIGLSLVRTLAELHGGSAVAESEGEGKGTTFTVRFPLASVPALVLPATAAESSRLPIRRSVVVVEDNEDVRHMIQLWLQKAGHDVHEAHDGPTGVEAVMAARPHVALIDLDLPGFDGCEVARRLRLEPALKDVRLVAVSGYGRPEDRTRALEAGFDEHFVKPLDFARLHSLLSD